MKTAQDSQGGTHEVWGCTDGAFNVWSEPVRKISLLINKDISCIFFVSSLLHGLYIMWMGKITAIFFSSFHQGKSNLGCLSHTRVECYSCAHIAKRLDTTDELYIFTLRAFFTTNIKDSMRRRYVLSRTGIWTVRGTKLWRYESYCFYLTVEQQKNTRFFDACDNVHWF